MANATGSDCNQSFICARLWRLDFFDRERSVEFVEKGGSHKEDKGLGLSGSEEELHRTAHALAQLVRSREIHSPLTDDGIKKSLHEFREVHNRESARHVSAVLTLCENLSEQADTGFFRFSHVRRTDGIHRASQHHRSPEWAVSFRELGHRFIKSAQALRRCGLTGQF